MNVSPTTTTQGPPADLADYPAEHLPFVTALCPTFRHPSLLQNSLSLWNSQEYPANRRELVILDDDPTFESQRGPGFVLHAFSTRFPSLPEKYNYLLSLADERTEIFLVWEDDDIYLPGYIWSHVRALWHAEFSKPSIVYSDYTGRIAEEPAGGRFHASIAFRRSLIERIGGWPITKRADFDQQLIANLLRHAQGVADPAQQRPLQYVYGWRTGHAHCQTTMRSPDDETWYDRAEQAYAKVPFQGKLVPRLDNRTLRILQYLNVYNSFQ